MDATELNTRGFAKAPIGGVAFLLNDSVRVVSGPHAGAVGAVISLLALSFDPRYLVELDSGADVHLAQSAP